MPWGLYMLSQIAKFSYYFMAELYSIVYIFHIFFIHSSICGTLRLFPYTTELFGYCK